MTVTPSTSEAIEADLEVTRESLRAYRKSDPNFERAIADYVDAEASLKEDPAEGLLATIFRDCPSAPASRAP